MFCFCLHSSLLKLQALDVDEGTSPEDSPPPLGSKELKTPSVPDEPGWRTAAVCYRGTTDENNSPGTLVFICLSSSVLTCPSLFVLRCPQLFVLSCPNVWLLSVPNYPQKGEEGE